MTLALILMIILTILMLLLSAVSLFVGYKSLIAFLAIQEQHEEYRRYLNIVLNEITERSSLFRTDLAKKLSLNIPETKELNGQLFQLETRIQSLMHSLREFLTEDQ